MGARGNEIEPEADEEPGGRVVFGKTLYFDKSGGLQQVSRPAEYFDSLVYEDLNLPCEGRIEHIDYRVVYPPGTDKNSKIKIAFFERLHPNEDKAASEFSELLFEKCKVPYLEVRVCHVAAGILGRRNWIQPIGEEELNTLDVTEVRKLTLTCEGTGLDTYTSAPNPELKQQAAELLKRKGLDDETAIMMQQQLKDIADLVNEKKVTEAKKLWGELKGNPDFYAMCHGKRLTDNGKIWYLDINVDLNREFYVNETDNTWGKVLQTVVYPEAR